MIKGLSLLMHRMERHFSTGIRRHIYTQVQQFVQVSMRESIRKAVNKKKLQTKTYDVIHVQTCICCCHGDWVKVLSVQNIGFWCGEK